MGSQMSDELQPLVGVLTGIIIPIRV